MPPPDTTLMLAVQKPGAIATARVADTELWRALDRHGLTPAGPAIDFYRMAAAVYAADNRILRRHAFDRWTRDFVLHLPVAELAAWERVRDPLTRLLQFLTGDRWELLLRAGAPPRPPVDRRAVDRAKVPEISGSLSLLSGGLDSFVGALDALCGRPAASARQP